MKYKVWAYSFILPMKFLKWFGLFLLDTLKSALKGFLVIAIFIGILYLLYLFGGLV